MKRLGEFLHQEGIEARLEARGITSDGEALNKARAFREAAQTLAVMGVADAADVHAFFVPGRIEVVGKHTDYAGGRSILCAVERGFSILAAPREDNRIRMRSIDGKSDAEFTLDPEIQPAMGRWEGYPMTVARRVARNFPSARHGVDIAFASDLPRASGMSSSSAMVVACFMVLAAVNKLTETQEYREYIRTPEDLAGYLGTTENGQTFKQLVGDRGVGTFGGSEDHTAILLSKPGKLVQYSYCPVRLEREMTLPPGIVLAIASSGVIAEKTGGAMQKYNDASGLARKALAAWNEASGRRDATLAQAVGVAGGKAIREVLEKAGPELADRFEQFYAETEEIVPAFGAALERCDEEKLGELVDRSQELTETKLKNQVPETVFLARSARELGAVAASAFGAGFGGSVWALVMEGQAEAFLAEWRKAYAGAYAECAARAEFFTTRAGPAAFEL